MAVGSCGGPAPLRSTPLALWPSHLRRPTHSVGDRDSAGAQRLRPAHASCPVLRHAPTRLTGAQGIIAKAGRHGRCLVRPRTAADAKRRQVLRPFRRTTPQPAAAALTPRDAS
eukprot:366232-Chlamydomonas_euryale.AAC.18